MEAVGTPFSLKKKRDVFDFKHEKKKLTEIFRVLLKINANAF
jgi:hypothetical protein